MVMNTEEFEEFKSKLFNLANVLIWEAKTRELFNDFFLKEGAIKMIA